MSQHIVVAGASVLAGDDRRPVRLADDLSLVLPQSGDGGALDDLPQRELIQPRE